MQTKEKVWQRIFGRLQRRASITLDNIMRHQHPRDSPQYRDPRTLPEGIDVYPGMDRDPAPTDPEVYNRQPLSEQQPSSSQQRERSPCNHYARPIDIRRLQPGQLLVPLQISEAASSSVNSPAIQELEEILNNLGSPLNPINPQSETESHDQHQEEQPQQQQQPEGDLVYDYVTMRPLAAAAAAAVENRQRPAQPLPVMDEEHGEASNSSDEAMAPPTPRTPRIIEADMAPVQAYDNLPPLRIRRHATGRRHAPIPQGSPPLPRQRNTFPAYYRDCANLLAIPAYSLICHSAWYAQASDEVIMCMECATAEHLFCAVSRPQAAWRHIHIIARNFYHTTMHCGRCYRLILRTKRAIDCNHCRLYVIEHNREIERIVYRLLCDSTVPYPYHN